MRQAQHHSFCTSIRNLDVAPSGELQNRKALESEVAIVWNQDHTDVYTLPWVRESFTQAHGRNPAEVKGWLAYSVDELGHKVRHWWHRETDFSDYAELGTCPREAIYPLSIEAGRASLPALPYCTQLEA